MTIFKKGISVLIFCSCCFSTGLAVEQQDTIHKLFVKFSELYNSGDFSEAEKCMLTVLDSGNDLPVDYLIAALNNAGLVKKSLGMFSEALDYYNKAEIYTIKENEDPLTLAWIYNNKSRIYTFQKSFPTAIGYLEKSVRIYQGIENPDKPVLNSLSTAWLNLGIIYYEMADYSSALLNLEKSAKLKLKNDLPETELTFLNLAKTYDQSGKPDKAEEYFTKSLNIIKSKFGERYYRMSEVYFGYGNFLYKTGRVAEALEAHLNALNICLENYGEKHSLVALSWKQLADYYIDQADFATGLNYYQKALMAIDPAFTNNDIFTNPVIDSSLFDIRLLDILKNKSKAFELYAKSENDEQLKLKLLNAGLSTVNLAFKLTDRIRNSYQSEDSRMYLAGNGKEMFMTGVETACSLYNLTGEDSFKGIMYDILQQAKAAVLRNDITVKEMYGAAGIPDSTREKHDGLANRIAAYSMLISGESRVPVPDSSKLQMWKDELFTMNREMEKLTGEIDGDYPQYRDLIRKTEPVELEKTRKNLHRNETIIDYLVSDPKPGGERDLFLFVITQKKFEFRQVILDSLFAINAGVIRDACRRPDGSDNFSEFTGALEFMYHNLIEPVEELFAGKKLIIIPDEEIVWLPFDILLREKPRPEETEYQELQYLIHNYSISYRYSSSLISGDAFPLFKNPRVFSFVPHYDINRDSGSAPIVLMGTGTETRSIYRWFRGKIFEGDQATEANFRVEMRRPAIFHLAMHSVADTADSRFSYLQFDTGSGSPENGKLYNYEISLSDLKSPMVVVSACNSGTGTLYHGEGLMSLARGFILAGASSVIKTSWEVNDEISAEIVSRFYKNLSKGWRKDDALRLAKIEYLNDSPPVYSNPYFWAAYEVLGNNAPIRCRIYNPLPVAGIVLLITFSGLILYLRRRKILSARSL